MIAALLAYLREGWVIHEVSERLVDRRLLWILVRPLDGPEGVIRSVPLPDGWVKPQ